MSSPIPKTPLDGHCSVIYDNTLYVYSPEAFQALPLKKGGKWTKLSSGVPVTGAACVSQSGNVTDSSDALWVVGGTTKSKYPGLQKFSFATKKWQTITPLVEVTANRQAHASVYLPGTSQILVYAGSQDDPSIPSIETFLIGTTSPYGVESFTSSNTPAVWPQLVQWDDSTAITLGGSDTNNQIYHFDPSQGGWSKMKPTLPAPLKSSDQEQATLVQADDGSKVLELFDLSVSPNKLTQLVLQEPNGKPAPVGQVPGQSSGKKRKRDLTLKSWPNYNADSAPKQKRSGFAIAQGSNNMVAISGGNKNDPVQLFNQQTNAWVNGLKYFGPQPHPHHNGGHGGMNNNGNGHQPSPPPPQVDQDSDHPTTSLILGATLGSVLGFIAILIIVLLYLRYRRQKARRSAEDDQEMEKDRLSFADRGDPYMKEIGASGYHPHEPIPTEPIPDPKGHRRSETRGSENSTTMLVPKKEGSYRMNEAMEMGPIREGPGLTIPTIHERDSKVSSLQVPGTQQKRTSGWSRYFSGAELSSIGVKSARTSASATNQATTSTRASGVNATTSRKSGLSASSTRSSRDTYSNYDPSIHDCKSHGPTEIPPLDMGQSFDDDRINRVVTGNNVISTSNREASRSSLRPRTVSSSFSSAPPSTIGDTIFTRDQRDETTNWTPVTPNDYPAAGARNTTTSSIYATSTDAGDVFAQKPRRISAPGQPPAKMANGATVLPWAADEPISEESEDQLKTAKPAVATIITVPPVKKPEQAIVQDDMGWIDLGARK